MSNKIEGWKILIGIYLVLLSTNTSFAVNQNPHKLYVGWSTKSITPDKPVALSGQFGTRISREIMDSVTCTAMAIETRNGDESIE
ncbi:hypothetical protein, partial [Mariniphaga sediminis]